MITIFRTMNAIVVLLFASLGGFLGKFLEVKSLIPLGGQYWPYAMISMGTICGGVVGFVMAPWISKWIIQTTTWIEQKLQKTPMQDIAGGVIGLIIGLIIAVLLGSAFSAIQLVGDIIKTVGALLFGYLGLSLGVKKKDELLSFLHLPKFNREKANKTDITVPNNSNILDTSVIIDGRIADICKSGFIEGQLIIPNFVLEELRHIADSSDLLKRNRGRRGLDILNKIRKELNIKVFIDEQDFEEISEVDSKLVKLAQVRGAKVLTNDYNLNKIAELQGVTVLNINELANAVKPVVLPGEEMIVQVIKDGKENAQGVAYLDDGTMIVVDNGKRYMGQTISVLVTSVLQTAAGRMIFAKPKNDRKTGTSHYDEVNMIG